MRQVEKCFLGLTIALVVLSSGSAAAAITSAMDRVGFLAPGLSLRLLCAVPTGQKCTFGDPNEPGTFLPVRISGGMTDALGGRYLGALRPFPCGIVQPFNNDASLLRLRPDDSTELVLRFLGACDGTRSLNTGIGSISIDPINGSALLQVVTGEFDVSGAGGGMQLGQIEEVTEVNGLPTVLAVIPEGPAGPTGPQGPLGPPGPPGPLLIPCPDADADGFRDCVTVPGCFPYGAACGDCDDASPTINPRGSETEPRSNRRDGKDNDCNGVIDG